MPEEDCARISNLCKKLLKAGGRVTRECNPVKYLFSIVSQMKLKALAHLCPQISTASGKLSEIDQNRGE